MKLCLIIGLLVVAVLAFGIYVRLAPSSATRFHVLRDGLEERDFEGGAIRVAEGSLAALDKIAQAEPRTKVVAGGVDEGMITYISRTAFWGFPDYTTVKQDGQNLIMHARLRFGRSDFGVNAKRLERWIDQL
ncbi:DUF1499 domain-containing protein [Lentibacter algarum]|uniref:DUF1499 domain-containing protein n=1 Tax=Lentibacter algarum TaxID=576131 RepID=UPI001C096F65|nr:DUF1499 domain-containing protein [Lentibacter algarum]MBU2982777.1 DUF1499 domain-containing protein [Lentibacter algarum]